MDTITTRLRRHIPMFFAGLVTAHWLEHLAQCAQIWVLHWPRGHAHGLLGLAFPWLVRSEYLHYGYAAVMLIGIWYLRSSFSGTARFWWNAALWTQAWHHVEHALLLLQAWLDWYPFGSGPVSIVQALGVARVELHLFYNGIVTILMLLSLVAPARTNQPVRGETIAP